MAHPKNKLHLVTAREPDEIDHELGGAMARTLHLLSQAAIVGVCKGRMRNLVSHLALLAEHPQAGPEVRAMSDTLLRKWQAAQQQHFGDEEVHASTTRH